MKPKTHSHVLFQPSKNGCLLLDQKTERIHSLNRTAAFIWTFCDGKHTIPQIEEALKTHWDGAEKDVPKEVSNTLRQFVKLGLIKK